MDLHGIAKARTEVRTCGWLAQVDENGGSIFHYPPTPRGPRTWPHWSTRS